MRDGAAMQRAQALADAARRQTPPWPWVGCVVVSDGLVVGQGATGPFPSGPHAEVAALRSAGSAAHGATVYTTLEPCNHDGNTPACTGALLAAGVRRVVVALEDPDPKVAGSGLARLRDAGVDVVTGVGAEDAAVSLRPYLHHRRTGRPFVVAKLATSLDGRIAAVDGSSRWITGRAARVDVHRLRAESQAIVVGSGTALADHPSLTVRDAPAPMQVPLRVVLDGRGRVPAEGPLFDRMAPTLVVTTSMSDDAVRASWRAADAEVETAPAARSGVDLRSTLDLLGRRGVLQALVEGGPSVHASFLAADLVDQLVVYAAATVLGADAPTGWGVAAPATLERAERWRLTGVRAVGDDVRLELCPRSAGGSRT